MNAIDLLLQKVTNSERESGTMTVFQSLSKDEQVALLEWSRSICVKLASYIEKRAVISHLGGSEKLDLPLPKMYVELALKIGVIRAQATNNPELLKGCETAFKEVLGGETRIKAFEEFKHLVALMLQLSKW